MRDWTSCMQTINGVDVPTLRCLEIIFANILTMAISLATLALFVMFIVGGFKFLTSGGDQKASASARQTLTYAVAGIALMAVAFIIFRIIEEFTGLTVTRFFIPQF